MTALRIDRLQILREQRGWSQRELASRANIGLTQIHKYESEDVEPSAGNLKSIADQLGVSVDYLLGRTDEPQGTYGSDELSEDEKAVLLALRRDGWPGVGRLSIEQMAKRLSSEK